MKAALTCDEARQVPTSSAMLGGLSALSAWPAFLVRDKPTAYGRATLKGSAVPHGVLDGGFFEPEQDMSASALVSISESKVEEGFSGSIR